MTGDLHGDLERLKSKSFKKLKKGDTLIVCGDFGFVWDGGKKEQKVLKWIGKRRYQVLFVDGTHENFDRLFDYEKYEFGGAEARHISGKLSYLQRGCVYEIEGKKIFTFGGGESENIETREKNKLWWPQEMPEEEEFARGRENLRACGNEVDYIITHETTATVRTFLDMDCHDINNLHDYLDEIAKTTKFKGWYFGNYHMDKMISPLYTAVFKEVVALK
ncbi:metallophosphoesterase [Zongyangia hominis]|uniref:metallophosphoesterase n=1 Tax=Zongyangia hominis TaxID=2763677 RepID=UPI0021CC6D6F|nr:metallophosphoesterase [Zongyangia hominis]